jgi:hypothetical protein
MTQESDTALRALLAAQDAAALATLHRGEPAVSMVPFALAADGPDFLIHVSALAPHTRDMELDPRVSLLVMAPNDPAVPAQARPRASFHGTAEPLARDSAGYAAARTQYLARFADAEPIFALGDFTLVRIRTHAARFVGGFAQAHGYTRERLDAALRGL